MSDPAEITARPGPEPDAMFEIPFSRIEEMRVERERLSARVAVLEAQKQAALELHSKQARFTADGWEEFSFSSVEEMQESLGDPDEDPMSYSMFEVCVHCGSVETHRQDSDDEGRSYEYSVWPCATVRALGGEKTS